MFTFSAHEGPVTSVAFAGPTGSLLSTGVDGHVKLWNPLTGELLLDIPAADPVRDAASSGLLAAFADSTGRFAAVGVRGPGFMGIGFIELETGRDPGSSVHSIWIRDLVPSPDGRSLFVHGRGDAPVPRPGRQRPRQLRPVEDGAGYVWQIAFPPDAQELVRAKTGGRGEGRLAVAPDGSEVLVGPRRFVWPAGVPHESGLTVDAPANVPRVISHDKDKLFVPNGTRLGVWSYEVGVLRRHLKGHVAPITALVATPDGRKLWTASLDATVRRWDVDTYAMETTYRFPGGPLSCVAVSPDGNLAAAGCAHKGTITVWDLS